MTHALSATRKSIFPQDGDDWNSIAERECDFENINDAVSALQSWNLHVFMRRVASKTGHEQQGEILPSDVIFLEPPIAAK